MYTFEKHTKAHRQFTNMKWGWTCQIILSALLVIKYLAHALGWTWRSNKHFLSIISETIWHRLLHPWKTELFVVQACMSYGFAGDEIAIFVSNFFGSIISCR